MSRSIGEIIIDIQEELKKAEDILEKLETITDVDENYLKKLDSELKKVEFHIMALKRLRFELINKKIMEQIPDLPFK